MFDDLDTAIDAHNKVVKNTERLTNKVECAILEAISEYKFSADCYFTDVELAIVSPKLTELGYRVEQKERTGSLTKRFQISW